MNFADLGLDLQGVMKRTYANLYYESTFMNWLNPQFQEVARQTGTPVIEVAKQNATAIHKRTTVEIATAVSTPLANYQSVMVQLTDLAMDYGFKISPTMITANIANTIDGQLKLTDSEIAVEIDTYGYDKLNSAIIGSADGSLAYTVGQCYVWAPADATAYITAINGLVAKLFNRKIRSGYMLGLIATEYANFVTALTSILKYETRAGVEGVDKGIFGVAYGVDTFQIMDSVATYDADGDATNVKGYFGHVIGTVGDMYFSQFNEFPGNYQGFPGYYVVEGNILFGASVVRPEALIKLVGSLTTITAFTFDDGQVGSAYSKAMAGTGITAWSAVGLPTGLTINAGTGAISGTPTVAGTFSVTVLGKDTYGNYANPVTRNLVIAPASE